MALAANTPLRVGNLPFVLHDDIILMIHSWEMQPDAAAFRAKAPLLLVWLPLR